MIQYSLCFWPRNIVLLSKKILDEFPRCVKMADPSYQRKYTKQWIFARLLSESIEPMTHFRKYEQARKNMFSYFSAQNCQTLLVPAVTNQLQDVQEEVENVQIEIDGRQDVLLRRELVHHHVRVKYNKQGEQDGTSY